MIESLVVVYTEYFQASDLKQVLHVQEVGAIAPSGLSPYPTPHLPEELCNND